MGGLRLRAAPVLVRLGLTGAILTLLGGLAASLAQIREHHRQRDGRPGLSLDDVRGAYAGLAKPSALASALERGHPEDLPAADRSDLLAWLAAGQVVEQYDSLELGSRAPAEILDQRCVSCHSRNARPDTAGAAGAIPLDYWDDVEKLAFSRQLEAVPLPILIVSTHTHALSMALIALAVIGLTACTRFSAALLGLVAAAGGAGLAADVAGQWLARWHAAGTWLVILGGAAFALHVGLGSLLALAEMWLPERTNRAGGDQRA